MHIRPVPCRFCTSPAGFLLNDDEPPASLLVCDQCAKQFAMLGEALDLPDWTRPAALLFGKFYTQGVQNTANVQTRLRIYKGELPAGSIKDAE